MTLSRPDLPRLLLRVHRNLQPPFISLQSCEVGPTQRLAVFYSLAITSIRSEWQAERENSDDLETDERVHLADSEIERMANAREKRQGSVNAREVLEPWR